MRFYPEKTILYTALIVFGNSFDLIGIGNRSINIKKRKRRCHGNEKGIMTKNNDIVTFMEAFSGPEQERIRQLLRPRQKTLSKRGLLFGPKQTQSEIAWLVRGRIQADLFQPEGARILVAVYESGDLIGDPLSLYGLDGLLHYEAMEECEVVIVNVDKLRDSDNPFDLILERDMLRKLFRGQSALLDKILFCSHPNLRQKILHYLHSLPQNGQGMIEVPFDRAQMANYLNADRAALSKELGKMKQDGIIKFRKNQFFLLDKILE